MLRLMLAVLILPLLTFAQQDPTQSDPYLWLEEIQATKSLSWVQQENSRVQSSFMKGQRFEDLKASLIEFYNKKDFLGIWRSEDEVFYVKVDSNHPRGQLLSVHKNDFTGENSPWKLLIDLDQLSKDENKSYVFSNLQRLPKTSQALISLSEQGRDEVIVREFDLAKGKFIKDGFELPLSKTSVFWLDKDTLLIGYNEGPDSITDSSYSRRVRYWKRGTPLKDAELLIEAPKNFVGAWPGTLKIDGKFHGYVLTAEENGEWTTYILNEKTKTLVKWPLHPKASVLFAFKNQIVVSLTKPWTLKGVTYPADTVLGFSKSELDSGKIETIVEIFKPDGKIFPQNIFKTKSKILITALSDAQPQLYEVVETNNQWTLKQIPTEKGTNYELASASGESDEVWFQVDGHATPLKLIEFNSLTYQSKTLQEQLVKFSLADIEVKTEWAVSKDGTKVPYTTIALKQDPKNAKPRPTVQYGYGGFRASELPAFSERRFLSWIMRGGVFVVTNIRGGLEFGEDWHQQAIRENKQNVFDDFIAISEDLIKKKVTTAEQLAINGGSNGGLLVAAVAVQRPELYKAVVCQVPLTDMLRFDKLLAGSSWVNEYGDPDDPKDRVFLEKYSPYQNVKANVKMPATLFMTSTNDDRVHPGHARKMAAKMIDQGHEAYLFEETEGGHGGGVPIEIKAANQALVYEFLSQQLGLLTPVSVSLGQYVRPSTNQQEASEYLNSTQEQKQEACSKHLDNTNSKPEPSSKD